jgi:hypothetical protein
MQKIEIGIETVSVQQRHEIQLARSSVHPFRRPVFRGIGMHDALSQGLARGQQEHPKGHKPERLHCWPASSSG